jgi:hypothetical protein
LLKLIILFIFTEFFVGSVFAQGNHSKVTLGDAICIESNSIPDHNVGKFPNRANPHSIREQRIKLCVHINPLKNSEPQFIKGTIGVALNGIQFRPNTAGSFDPSSESGHSRNGDKRWTLDVFGAKNRLGLDMNNGHVGPNGLYHYHGIAESLTTISNSSFIGYAGDGFEIHFLGKKVRSGYKLRSGWRPSGPKGAYDGTFNEDYVYSGNHSTLDECNGGMLNGKYAYFITLEYPFIGRCLWGDIAPGFGADRH